MDKLEIVRVFNDRMSAEMAKNILESHGIESMISGDDAGGMRPDILVVMGGAKLMVLSGDLGNAAEILDAHFNDDDK